MALHPIAPSSGVPGMTRERRKFPEDMSFDEWARFYRLGSTQHYNYVEFNTFTGSDIRPLAYFPPNPEGEEDERLGKFIELGDLQTITVSTHRPTAKGRTLGRANVVAHARGVRTIAGTMIFNRVDQDAFLSVWARCELERPDLVPFFIDQMPPFHVILHAQNEMGLQASAAILHITLTDTGEAFTIEDLVPENTATYEALYFHPFLDRDRWIHELRDAVSTIESRSGLSLSALAPSDVGRNILDEDYLSAVEGIDY